jgi:thioredoxin-related protein
MKKLLYFGKEGCTQCFAMKRVLEKFDYEESHEYDKYDIMALPTIILVDDKGNELKRHSGYMTASQLTKWLAD